MILGIGHDQVNAERVAAALARFGTRFLNRIYTAEEQARAAAKANPVPTLARRWAAKEACAKALGTGIGAQAFMHEIGVSNDAAGKPVLALSGRAASTLLRLVPQGCQPRLHLSISDDWPIASAYVIIEAVPDLQPLQQP